MLALSITKSKVLPSNKSCEHSITTYAQRAVSCRFREGAVRSDPTEAATVPVTFIPHERAKAQQPCAVVCRAGHSGFKRGTLGSAAFFLHLDCDGTVVDVHYRRAQVVLNHTRRQLRHSTPNLQPVPFALAPIKRLPQKLQARCVSACASTRCYVDAAHLY